MPRTTRAHTIRRHLVDGGLTELRLTPEEQKNGPDGPDVDGFALRQQYDEQGAYVVVAGAYGPDWLRTLAEVSGRLEQRHIRCTVIAEAPGVADHEVMVRWATPEELQARDAAAAKRQAPLKALLQQPVAEQADEEPAGLFELF
jgi:hypothetical protein